jgi:hypothetical protein
MRLRVPLAGAVVLTFLVAVQAGAHRHRPDHVVESFVIAWNQPDVDAMVDLFEEDADLSYSDASYARGRVAIRSLLEKASADRAAKLSLKGPLNSRERWHWAIVDYRAELAPGGGNPVRPLIITAVLVQTKDGPGEFDCRDHRPCDEWSVSAMRIIVDRGR